ncbi:MAG: D-alanyl-D-alanine carboxypeptidase/D-alanyl-D-alanine-endopeptidase [Fidelibacterota bacterium]
MPSARRLRLLFAFVMILFTGSCAFRSGWVTPRLTSREVAQLKEQIDGAVTRTDPDLTFGMKAVSLKTGEILYERNSTHRFTPASNMKLFTAAAALHILGPYYRFRTALYADSSFVSDTVPHNLYLRAGGDPDLTHQDLDRMTEDLELQNIATVVGDLVVDASEFDTDQRGPGWMWDDVPYRYAAPVSAMTLNDNCVVVHISPGKSVGDAARARLEPPTGYASVTVNAVTVGQDSVYHPIKVTRRWKTRENVIEVTGDVPAGSRPESHVITIESPPLYAGTVLKELIQARGIEFQGVVREDTIPSDTILLSLHRSRPLSETVRNLLKNSDNLTAELLVKKLGSVTADTTGTWLTGLQAVKTFLQDEVKLDTTTLVMADGSGVSRYNLLSPDHLVHLLIWVYKNFKIFPEFSSSLPIGGGDGTLSARMAAEELRDRTRAKTGTLQGVSSLSGYLVTRDNETVVFSIMMNGYVGENSRFRQLQDEIVAILTSFSRF